jgi:hypothetical protein
MEDVLGRGCIDPYILVLSTSWKVIRFQIGAMKCEQGKVFYIPFIQDKYIGLSYICGKFSLHGYAKQVLLCSRSFEIIIAEKFRWNSLISNFKNICEALYGLCIRARQWLYVIQASRFAHISEN